MARPGPQTQAKRMREAAKLEKRRVKEEKRAIRKQERLRGPTEPSDPAAQDRMPS